MSNVQIGRARVIVLTTGNVFSGLCVEPIKRHNIDSVALPVPPYPVRIRS